MDAEQKWGVFCTAANRFRRVEEVLPRYTAITRAEAKNLARIAAIECCTKGSRHPVRRLGGEDTKRSKKR